ncbi:MAG: hypothetical protein COU81_00060 [Candidatus Portnoybacteria bacterium CG10_big_fil_rev_8_21_14_0_10_36_7]|uniref:Methyltransferase type 11 domain-containing protein n=1 Tax=Candidatus Portnoybacteria bacterium CG10_big_fil_rev_8_21_14_0_10_36_7 TaxID=1974812 RepID=A0A2M8KF64_9BACT|nr:MAG: hypothetical protein COU81_00060 [Candidatus Portnoybacteria bacterium CG10_big_fil_rev_8_21_14_0_10_36_7]
MPDQEPGEISKTAFREILKARKLGRERKQKEEEVTKSGSGIAGNVWGQYAHNYFENKVLDYDVDLGDALEAFGIDSTAKFLVERKKAGFSTNVLDLMGGDPTYFRDLNKQVAASEPSFKQIIDKGLSVSLGDDRSIELKEQDKKSGIDVLCGDILSKQTWAQIDLWQKNNNVEYFDFIVCRGADGIWTIPAVAYPFIFQKVWERLTDKNGLFVTQFSKSVETEEMREMDQELLRKYPTMKHFVNQYQKSGGKPPVMGIIKTGK